MGIFISLELVLGKYISQGSQRNIILIVRQVAATGSSDRWRLCMQAMLSLMCCPCHTLQMEFLSLFCSKIFGTPVVHVCCPESNVLEWIVYTDPIFWFANEEDTGTQKCIRKGEKEMFPFPSVLVFYCCKETP